MTNVVILKSLDDEAAETEPSQPARDMGHSAEIILFPGVFYCRRQNDDDAQKRQKPRLRDWVILTPSA